MSFQSLVVPLRKSWFVVKDFLSSPRAFISVIQRFSRDTDYERWSRAGSLQANWDERTLMMAAYIQAGASVIEFGAGAQVLRAALPAGCRYQPSDLVARTPDTLVCDLNSGYPDLGGHRDVAVLSGVLEYIKDLPGLFHWLCGRVDKVIFSYATFNHTPSLLARRKNGWSNDLSEEELLRIVLSAGFQGRVVTNWRGHTIFVVVHQ